MATTKRKRRNLVKLYIDDAGKDAIWAVWANARRHVDVPITLDRQFVGISQRGMPWTCLASNGVHYLNKTDPTAFNHKVHMVYTQGDTMYIIDRKPLRPNQMLHAIRYEHNFTKRLRHFDTFTKAKFLEEFGDQGVVIKLKPPRVRGKPGERGTQGRVHGQRLKIFRSGARRRAEDAGLIPKGLGKSDSPDA